MIVEDDPGAVAIFTQVLTSHGYGVQVARDAESGLLEIQRALPAAILLDLHLPVADGIEFLRRLRTSNPGARMPIAVVTGDYFVDEDIFCELQALHARVHFKPLWEEDLLTLVDELLRS
ncbi:MAG TPA: response regulator [Vicinamibacterales bacterium]